MRNILITGFDPFGGETSNPSFEAVKLLKDKIGNFNIIKREIPTEFYRSKDVLLNLIEEYKPVVVINVGQAGGRETISLENQAFNLIEASIPDNAGVKPEREKISINGPEILLSKLPLEDMKNELLSKNIDCYISDSAGRYVCNYVMYSMLQESTKYGFISGFIHVPFSKEQALLKKEKVPFMEISKMTEALEICINAIIKK